MSQTAHTEDLKVWTPIELRALPAAQRDAILAAAAAVAEQDYRSDPNLTAFEAFDEGDLNGENGDAEAR
jgi:hypothetical protein